MYHSGAMRSFLAIALALIASPAMAAASPAPQPLELEDVVALIEAGVGADLLVRQASPAGLAFTLGVKEIVALKRAGAGDDLIGRLMDLASAPPADVPAGHEDSAGEEPAFRVFPDQDTEGRPVLHITNLDASGRRMGGDPAPWEPPPTNAYHGRDEAEPETGSWDLPPAGFEEPYAGDPEGAHPPVIVNVFNPWTEAAAFAETEVPVGRRRYVSGVLPYVPCTHAGHRGRHLAGVNAPPGSWTHYQLYHSGQVPAHAGLYNGTLAWRGRHPAGYGLAPAGVLPVPFHTSGAATLNRMRANVRLGH